MFATEGTRDTKREEKKDLFSLLFVNSVLNSSYDFEISDPRFTMETQRSFHPERALLYTSFVGVAALNLGMALWIPVLELIGAVLLLPLVALYLLIPIIWIVFAARSVADCFRAKQPPN